MKLLAFTDTHHDAKAYQKIKAKIKKHKPDLLVCCGDISIFEHNIEKAMHKLASLNLPMLIIHGNHESEQRLKKLCTFYQNITFLHEKTKEIGDITFIGYGGGGFARTEEEFEKFVQKIEKNLRTKNLVLLTHGPPHKTKLDNIYGDYVGCKSYTKFIKKNKNTILAISGHIHDTAGKQDKIGKTLLINPGPYGRVIEL